MRRCFALLSLVALLFASCERPSSDAPLPDDGDKPVELTLTTDSSVWFESAGGAGEIGYTLANASDDAVVSATSSVEWITDITVDDTVRYTVTSNGGYDERQATIVIAYDTAELEVRVYQRATRSAANQPMSSLESDYEFNIEDGIFVGAYVGDLMGTGCNTCQVYMWEYLDLETGEERGDIFQIDLQLPRGGTDICGEYLAGRSEGHFIAGWAEDVGGQYMQQNSWYMTADYATFAPIVSGVVRVESEDGVDYTFTIDVTDDAGHAICGTFKGWGEFTEW